MASTREDKTYTTTNIPPGGRKGQALVKATDKSYQVKWASGGSGGGGGDCGCEAMSIVDIINIINSNN